MWKSVARGGKKWSLFFRTRRYPSRASSEDTFLEYTPLLFMVCYPSDTYRSIAGALSFVGWIIAAIIGPALTMFYFRSLGLLYGQ